MRLLHLFITLFLLPSFVNAQALGENLKPNRNHILLEAGGAGVYGSLNYEYLFICHSKSKFLGRIGFLTYKSSYQPSPTEIHHYRDYIVPIGVTYLHGVKNHLEIGINNSFHIEKNKDDNSTTFGYLIIPTIGYRLENFFKNSVYFNAGFSPWIRYEHSIWEFQPSFKIGVGFSF